MKALKTQLKRIFVSKIVKSNKCDILKEVKKLRNAQGLTIKTKYELLEEVIFQLKGF